MAYNYSTLDCTSGCHHIALSPEVEKKSAFVTLIGKFKFKKVPFCLAQGPIYFQQFTNEALKFLSFTFTYLGDILVLSKNSEKYIKHLRPVFNRLKMADLKLKRTECDFLKM